MTQPRFWILDGHTPVPVDDVLTWAQWFETAFRGVRQTTVGEASVETVFIGINLVLRYGGPPHVFQTTVFGGPHDGDYETSATWDEAEAQHAAMVAKLEAERP
jgi:hypothetical protein